MWSEGLEVSWLPLPSISKGADFHFIPEQQVWKITHSPIIMLYNNHKTLTHFLRTCSKHREKPKHSVIKWANSIADLCIALGIPDRGPSLHLRSLAGPLREPPGSQMKRKGEEQEEISEEEVEIALRNCPLPSSTRTRMSLLHSKILIIQHEERKRHI